jgi:hypothetical protein
VKPLRPGRRPLDLLVALSLCWPALRPSEALAGRAEVGGYLRLGARPDLQGGDGRLGYWNLYGRLLNEGPYAALEFKFDALEVQPQQKTPWASLHLKVEGGSIRGADAGGGGLANFRLSQAYVQAGNVLLPDLVWQVGSLDTWFGDLGLYDMRPAEIFYNTVGMSARLRKERVDLLLGFGDSGYGIRGAEYSTILTPGGTLRVRLGDHVELGTGGELRLEPAVKGNRRAPYATPGLGYEEWVRGEVVESFFAANPGRDLEFPDPVSRSNRSWKAVGYLGFGGLGPLSWNNTFISYERAHPMATTEEQWQGETYTLYVADLTDERDVLLIGDEIQVALLPRRLDLALAGLYGDHSDGDNDIVPSDADRSYVSGVLRLEANLTETVHWLGETSLARERSRNGNAYREHADSIFANTEGRPDSRGLESGDTDTRHTWQGKTGFVFNPLGPGIYTRPSLRLLYGAQYSNQNNAFGNSFVENIDQYNEFGNVERHWHHLVALETEAWF